MKQKKTALRLSSAALSLILAFCLATCGLSAFTTSYATTVVNLNSAPVAENLDCTTFRCVAVTDSFRAVDPEGDAITFSIAKEPRKGVVTVDGDSFTYTPGEGKKGKDSFTYVAIDSIGNISPEATVTINIKKQSGSVNYSDMKDSSAWYDAVMLAETGIFVGEKLGNEYFFRPDEPVSRGEFLAMCMELCDAKLLNGVTRTSFYDDESIPMWQKPYIATALMSDLISGTKDESGHAVFRSDDPVTFAEATVMLNNALEITDVSVGEPDGDCPTWAYQAAMNLSACKIPTSDHDGVTASVVSRADAATMLCGAMDVLGSRGGSSAVSWAK